MFEWDYLIIFVIALLVGIFGTLAAQSTTSHETIERPSPMDRINESQIMVYEDYFCVYNLTNLTWGYIADSNSMDPIMDYGANIIEFIPRSEKDINIGDIISYIHPEDQDARIIHEVIDIGQDDDGIYYLTKGTNNYYEDNLKVRFDQVQGVYLGVLW